MANTYNWIISQLECHPQVQTSRGTDTDVVFTIHWRRQATDGTYMADVYGSQGITLDDTGAFTPYAELTKEQVEGWLADAMGAERVAELDKALDAQIEAQINPPVVAPPLPWNTESGATPLESTEGK